MPLRDHFHEPLDPRAEWPSFHNRWANAIADALDLMLPPRYFARVDINLGRDAGADVAEFESSAPAEPNGHGGSVAVQAYAPPAVNQVLAAVFPDAIEVQIRDMHRGSRLAAVIELVSPSNKDRPETRRAFAAKLSAYLQRGIGVVVADLVTPYHFNLHAELLALLGQEDAPDFADRTRPYAVAYRPIRRGEREEIDVWTYPLTLGADLPTVPLHLRGYRCIPLDLEATYQETCRRCRLT